MWCVGALGQGEGVKGNLKNELVEGNFDERVVDGDLTKKVVRGGGNLAEK